MFSAMFITSDAFTAAAFPTHRVAVAAILDGTVVDDAPGPRPWSLPV